MSNKHSKAKSEKSGSLLKQTPIFITCSAGYKPVYELFLHSVRQVKLNESQIKPLLYDFPGVTPQTPTGWRSAPWYQAQRLKFAYFRTQLSELAAGQLAIMTDADVQFLSNLDGLENILETMRARQTDLMIIGEHGGPVLNAGFIIAANTQASRTFFERVTVTLGDYNKPLHSRETLVSEGEPDQVVNRILQRTPRNELKWSVIPPEYVVFGGNVEHVRWSKVFLHHAICVAGPGPKKDLLGRVRHTWYNWKYTEATGFPTDTKAADPLAHMPRIPGGVWLARTQGRLWARDDGGIETRNPSVIKLANAACEKYTDIPDFAPVFTCTQDTPELRVPGMTVLAFSTDKRNARTAFGQTVVAVPDNVFDHWRNAGMPDYEETCAHLHAAGTRVPQKNVAGWIGNAHMHPTRIKLLEMAKKHPEVLEAINTGVWKQVPNMPRFEVGQGRYYSLPEQVLMYAFFLDVEGNGWSGRLKLLLHSGRPLLMQDRPWEEFYFSQLKPFEHYVPVAADMSDLVQQIQWLQSNPDESDRIAKNAQNFAMQHLTRAAAIDAWAQVMRALP